MHSLFPGLLSLPPQIPSSGALLGWETSLTDKPLQLQGQEGGSHCWNATGSQEALEGVAFPPSCFPLSIRLWRAWRDFLALKHISTSSSLGDGPQWNGLEAKLLGEDRTPAVHTQEPSIPGSRGLSGVSVPSWPQPRAGWPFRKAPGKKWLQVIS